MEKICCRPEIPTPFAQSPSDYFIRMFAACIISQERKDGQPKTEKKHLSCIKKRNKTDENIPFYKFY